jgi:SNF2 family DNA or RNA helicase
MQTVYPRQIFKTASIARNTENERVIKIKFPFSYSDIDKIKTLPDRVYHAKIKCWSAPLNIANLNKLTEWGFIFDSKINNYIKEQKQIKANKFYLEIPDLKGQLYPFQMSGVAFLDSKDGNCLNADDMGLGKTIETLAYLQLNKKKLPALIVVPASVKINWYREVIKWMSPMPIVQILSGETPYKVKADIIIINYDILFHWKKYLKMMKFNIIIADEAQALKNSQTKRYKAFKEIKKGIPSFMALTGTPIENHPSELYNVINMIDPTLYPVKWDYLWEFCDPKNTGWGWKCDGFTNIQKLHDLLTGTIMLRRLKTDVLPELPQKIKTIVPIELDNQNEYSFAEKSFIAWIASYKGEAAAKRALLAQGLLKLETLKQVCVKGKLKGVIQWVQDFLETDNKLVIVTTHTFVIEELLKAFPKISLRLDGSVTGNKRQEAIDKFNTDANAKLFIVNLKAGGIGINLTAACSEAIIELGSNPKLMDQVEDRIHRIGQTRGVNIYYLLAYNTVEEKIVEILDRKRKGIDGVIDGVITEQGSLLAELMKIYSK